MAKGQNAFLRKIQAAQHITNQKVIQTAINRDSALWMIVLNREFGFGKTRLQRCKEAVEALYEEYGAGLNTDFIYGDEIIDREIRKLFEGESEPND